jgi:hypothetical protein
MNVYELISPLGMATMVLAFAGVWAVLCRISVMTPGTTRPLVVLQHAVLATGLFAVAVWSVNWELAREFGAHGWVVDLLTQRELGGLIFAACTLGFLIMSSHRWRFAAPAGTQRSEA